MATKLEQGIDWGTAVDTDDNTIRYYFYGEGEKTPLGDSSADWSSYERGQFKLAFNIFETFLDLDFKKVDKAKNADLHLATNTGSDSLGLMFPPGSGKKSGFGEFYKNGLGWKTALEQGGFGFVTIIHELGHGLGLAHPHDKGGKSIKFPGVSDDGDFGKYKLNQGIYTTMTYNDGWEKGPDDGSPSLKYGYQGTPMAIDIAVLQAKYGANDDYKTGDSTYKLPKSNGVGTFYSTIWDAGGDDTIKFGGNRPALIDLRAATLKVEPGGGGFVSYADGIHGGFTIAKGVVIENAIGGDGDDFLMGNSAENVLRGDSGKDFAKGRSGKDELYGGKGKDELDGGSSADHLKGGSGDDKLKGRAGADILNGGPGADKMTGGSGADVFKFKDKLKNDKVDWVTDFKPGVDVFHLALSVFTKVGETGELAASAFHAGKAAADEDHRIIYKQSKGLLIYDKNGSEDGGIREFAKIDPDLSLSHEDFVIVG